MALNALISRRDIDGNIQSDIFIFPICQWAILESNRRKKKVCRFRIEIRKKGKRKKRSVSQILTCIRMYRKIRERGKIECKSFD